MSDLRFGKPSDCHVANWLFKNITPRRRAPGAIIRGCPGFC
jgi:hypothetical protein